MMHFFNFVKFPYQRSCYKNNGKRHVTKDKCEYLKKTPIKIIKFNKYKHKKCKWITNGILKSLRSINITYKIKR